MMVVRQIATSPNRAPSAHRANLPLTWLLACAATTFFALTAYGFQIRIRPGDEQNAYLELPTPPRELRQALNDAQRSIESQEFTDAVEALAKIASSADVEDSFIAPPGAAGAHTSVKATAQRMLGDLPAAGREIYELQFGREARRLLEQALRDEQIAGVTEVSRRFFHTVAGYEATLLLGRLELDHGQPLAASLHLQRLSNVTHVAGRFDPELPLLLATCRQMLGEPQQAAEILVALRQRLPTAKIRLGDREVALFEQDDQALVWLEQVAGPALRLATNHVDQWTMHRGGPTRNGTVLAGAPLPSLRWRQRTSVPSDDEPQDEQIIREQYKAYVNQGMPLLPAMQPLAVGDFVFMRTPRHLFGIHLDTGKLIWPWPWIDDEEVADAQAATGMGRPGTMMTAREERLQQAVWSDATYGQMSSDGELIFFLYQPPHLVLPDQIGRNQFGIRGNPNGEYPVAQNQLVAAELRTEGKTRWVVGGDDGDVAELQNAFFLGPPLPLGDELFVLAEIRDEIKLLVLQAATGKLNWSQQLATVEPIFGIGGNDPISSIRRLAGASPSYADGVMVCPTSAGAVVAVDIASRSLLWAYSYPTTLGSLRRQQGAIVFNPNPQSDTSGTRWQDATVTIADRRVIVTPVEGDELYCLDLLTGQPVWPKPLPRKDNLFVAGVHHELVLLVGQHEFSAVSLADGQSAYSPLTLPNQAMPSGRGFLTNDEYFLPTTEKQLVRFQAKEGKLLETRATPQQLGNLICYRDQVISLGHDWMYAFYQQDKLREIVARRLRQNPADPEMLEHQARLLLEDGHPEQGLEVLRRALEGYPPDSPQRLAAKELLIDILLATIEADFTQHVKIEVELNELVRNSPRRRDYLRIAALGYERTGEVTKAFDAYLDLAQLETEAPNDDESMAIDGLIQAAPGLQVLPQIWVGAQLQKLLQLATPEQRQTMDVRAQQLFAAVEQGGDRAALARLASLFPDQPQTPRAWLSLARDDIQSGRAVAAEQRLLMAQQASVTAATATAQLAKLYHAKDRGAALERQLKRLNEEWPSTEVEAGVTGQALSSSLSMAAQPGPRSLAEWPYGKVEIGTEPTESHPQPPNLFSIQLLETSGEWPNGWRIAYDQVNQRIAILDSFGQHRLAVPIQRTLRGMNAIQPGVYHAKAIGHVVVISLADQIIAIDALQPQSSDSASLLWQFDLEEGLAVSPVAGFRSNSRALQTPWMSPRTIAQTNTGEIIGWLGPVTGEGICVQKQRMLVCLDPLTGKPRWIRRDVDAGSELIGNATHVMAISERSEVARLFSVKDGSDLGTKPVPAPDRRIADRYGAILTWNGEYHSQLPVTLRFYDVATGTDRWQREVAAGTKADWIGADELGLLEPNGKFSILRIADGSQVMQAQVEPEQELQEIVVLRSRDQYILVASRVFRPSNNDRSSLLQVFPDARPTFGTTSLVSGNIFAFDRTTGGAEWATPARIDRFGFASDQPADVPVLFLSRLTNEMNRQGQRAPNRHGTEFLCLDRRTGQPLIAETIPRKYAYLADLHAVPEENTVTLELQGDRQFVLDFTEGARPPAPAFFHESAVDSSDSSGDSPLGSAIKAFGRAIEKLGK